VPLNVEWRVREGSDAIAVVDANGAVAEVAIADEALIKDYLAVTANLDRWRKWTAWRPANDDKREPEAWGELVMGRSETGEVLEMDPELFWERIYRWFRSRGTDYNL
jgi:hypothetical protein